MPRKTSKDIDNPVGGKQLNLVRDTENLAREMGFKIVTDDYSYKMTLYPTRGLSLAIFGKNTMIVRYDEIKDIKCWLQGWKKLESALLDKTLLTIQDIRESMNQREILNKLQKTPEDQ